MSTLIPTRGSKWKRGKETKTWAILDISKYEWGVSVCLSQGSGPFRRSLSVGLEDFHSEFKPVAKQKK